MPELTGLLRHAYRRLPAALRMAVLVKQREPLWVERGIVFIHVPKAAGTSINQALYGRFMGHARATDVEKWGGAKLRSLPRFAVIRNPWDRLVSAFRFAKRGGGIGETVAGIHNPEQYRVPEFDSFERFVHEWLATRDITKLDGVFQPQLPYVSSPDGRLMVDHLGRFENLRPTYEFIERNIGIIGPFARTNRSGENVDYRGLYTTELAKIVGEIYAEDAEAFAYEF